MTPARVAPRSTRAAAMALAVALAAVTAAGSAVAGSPAPVAKSLAASGAAAGVPPADAAFKAGVFEPPVAAPAFSLTGSDGAPLTLQRFRGRVVLLVFGFTQCPEVCPTTLAMLAQARRQLGADAAAVQVAYVTVDPERDDAARVKAYLAGFDRTFVGGTGTPAQVNAVLQRFGVNATKVPLKGGRPGDYAMAHSSGIWLVDREGRLRGQMPYGHDAADVVHDVRLLLAGR